MNEQEFQKRYKSLNKAQKEAVDTVEGPVMVVAGPGTGKTTVLTLRIANILKQTDAKPENILALTFTESGVVAMRKKLKSIIGTTAYRVPIYTFHGFSNMVIQTYPESFEDVIGRTPLADHEGATIIDALLKTHKGELLVPKNSPLFYSGAIRNAISTLKEANLTPEGYRDFLKREKDAIESSEDFVHQKGAHKGKIRSEYAQSLKRIEKSFELADLYEAYELHLRDSKRYDFNDMVLSTICAMQKDEVLLQTLQETYQYILADEHQDINTAQNTLIELLASFFDTPNLFVVGDDKQAIYRFQGASTENFVYLPKRFQNVKTIALTDNYRSTQRILDASGELISVHTDLISNEQLTSCPLRDGEHVSVVTAKDRRSELEHVAMSIKEKISEGTNPEDVAVLYRNNRHAEVLQEVLTKHGIGVRVHSATDLFSHPLIWRLQYVLRALSDLANSELLAKVLLLNVFEIESVEVYKIFQEVRAKRMSVIEVLKVEAQEVYEKIMHLNTVMRTEGVIASIELLVKELGFVEWSLAHDPESSFRALDTLFGLARTLQQEDHSACGVDLVAHLDLYIEHGLRVKGTHGEVEEGKVNLMTAHNSKGLEFPIVYIVHVEHGIWGGKANKRFFELPQINASGSIEDERRLFYVALTRAQHEVIVSYAERDVDGKELIRSQFIDELGEACIVTSEAAQIDLQAQLQQEVLSAPNKVTKEFIRNTFLKQGLAVTALNNYLACPWKFFFQNLLRVPHTPSPAQLFGTAMHAALQFGQETFSAKGKVLVDDVKNNFADALHNLPIDSAQFERYKKHGISVLGCYMEEYGDTAWVTDAKTEYGVRDVVMKIEDYELLLHGKIDRMELLPDNEVRVVDYKTGKQKTTNQILGGTKDSNGDLIRQLTFYKLLLDEHKDGFYRLKDATLDFVEPNEKGGFRKETFCIEAKQVEELKEETERVAKEILEVSFWDAKCDDVECEFCKMSEQVK